MKILLSFVFSLALFAGVSAQTAPVNHVATINFSVPDADAGIILPDCLFERIVKELQLEDLPITYLFTNNQGKRIYRYEIGPNEFGFISVSDFSCAAEIKFADDPNDLLVKLEVD